MQKMPPVQLKMEGGSFEVHKKVLCTRIRFNKVIVVSFFWCGMPRLHRDLSSTTAEKSSGGAIGYYIVCVYHDGGVIISIYEILLHTERGGKPISRCDLLRRKFLDNKKLISFSIEPSSNIMRFLYMCVYGCMYYF